VVNLALVFVSNLVAMATGVSRGRMILSLFNSQISAELGARIFVIFPYRLSNVLFCLKFRCHGNS